MKQLLFMLLFVFSISSSAQKIRFTNNTNQWNTLSIDGNACSNLNSFQYGADTIVRGITYKSMYSTWSNYFGYHYSCTYCGYSDGGDEINCLVREDTVTGIVYYLKPTDTSEHILYNYNLQVGDSISYGLITDTVASIDSTLSNGVYYRIWNLQNKAPGLFRSYTVLEGVGCTNDPVFPAWFGECFEFGESLTCFYEHDSFPVITAPINSCSHYENRFGCCTINTGVFNNAAGCSSGSGTIGGGSSISVSNIKQEIPYLAIFPNPAITQLTITAPDEMTSIVITNLLGQTVYNGECHSQKAEVDIADLVNGMYFVRVNGSEVRKFVKE